ncbi:biotin-dependent carboxyltransferase family protein [uncultured Aquimarina sp.]|uniref:5-oxoprolinase subunit C family protein n=1 Tax=uncultured Aquimarina sp. TaxID=575652 RepID=UPI00261DAD03|nr:biotin-dependent carboxyltransferase family protein [uncultured Aquimarina sp.]
MISSVKIFASGLYTTIQDGGRFGYSKYGVPKSGAMDLKSFFLANAILNNDENCAVIEWTMIPPVLKFEGDTIVSVTGAVCVPFLNDAKQKMNCQLRVRKGDVLKLKNVTDGVFGFVGIKSGFQSEMLLGSRSQYNMITTSFVLRKNDTISYNNCVDFSATNSSVHVPVFWNKSNRICVFEGPEFDLLSDSQKELLLTTDFAISNTRNRMAIPLDGQLENELSSMMSSPVLPGTVQLTPSGLLIILMRDCQTTGGYPRILQLSKDAINVIAQKRVGERIRFEREFL